MKMLLLLLTVITLSTGFTACRTSDSPMPAPGNPPGSGGRGDSPGQHAQNQGGQQGMQH